MPAIEAPLMHGSPAPDWDKIRATVSARCTSCSMVHPGRYMAELVGGLCRECVKKEKQPDKREKGEA